MSRDLQPRAGEARSVHWEGRRRVVTHVWDPAAEDLPPAEPVDPGDHIHTRPPRRLRHLEGPKGVAGQRTLRPGQ